MVKHTVKTLKAIIRRHQSENCPKYSRLRKADLLRMVMGIDPEELKRVPDEKKAPARRRAAPARRAAPEEKKAPAKRKGPAKKKVHTKAKRRWRKSRNGIEKSIIWSSVDKKQMKTSIKNITGMVPGDKCYVGAFRQVEKTLEKYILSPDDIKDPQIVKNIFQRIGHKNMVFKSTNDRNEPDIINNPKKCNRWLEWRVVNAEDEDLFGPA